MGYFIKNWDILSVSKTVYLYRLKGLAAAFCVQSVTFRYKALPDAATSAVADESDTKLSSDYLVSYDTTASHGNYKETG